MKLELTNASRITNEGGQLKMLEGPKAMEAMRYRTILIGLKSEASGMRLTRGVSCTKLAKELTGLKTNNREKLAARIQEMMNQAVAQCAVVTDGEME